MTRLLLPVILCHVRVTSKGQITIPEALRHEYGLLPNTEVDWVKAADGPKLIKRPASQSRGQRIVAALKANRPKLKMSAAQFMQLTRGGF